MAQAYKVLIIDADPLHLKILEHLLNDSKGVYQLYVAQNWDQASDIYEEKEVDVCLLDLHLPGEKEYQILSQYKQKLPGIPVIVLAQKNNEVLFQQSLKAGAYHFFVKGSIERTDLKRAIQTTVHKHRELDTLKAEKKAHIRLRSIIDTIETFSRQGHFSLDLISNEMEWSGTMFELLGIKRNSIASPSLSSYLEFVHPKDRQIVSNLINKVAENQQWHSLNHRLVLKGTNIVWVNLQLKPAQLPNNKHFSLVGNLLNLSLLNESPNTLQAKQHHQINVYFSLSQVMQLHLNTLKNYFELHNTIQEQHTKNLLQKLMENHVTLFEWFFQSLKDNYQSFSSDSAPLTMTDSKDLFQHISAYFWMRCTTVGLKSVSTIHTDNHMEIRLAYLPTFLLISSWMDLILKKINLEDYSFLSLHLNLIEEENNFFLFVEFQNLKTPVVDLKSDSKKPDQASTNNKELLQIAVDLKRCRLEMEKNKGGKFTERLLLPIKTTKQSSNTKESDSNNKTRILLAEDHFLNQIHLKKICEELFVNLHLDIVSNGREAIKKVESEASYHLILLDLKMPLMGGKEAAEKISQLTDAPLIALSTLPSHQELQMAKKAGFSEVLEKPVKKKDVRNLARKYGQ